MDPADAPVLEARSRWRLTVGRSAAVADQTQREVESAWGARLMTSALPLALTAARRPRLTFGAPLPTGMAAHADLIDFVLTERWPRWRVREAIERSLPIGWTLSGLDDVWLGAPSLTASVVAADYAITLADPVPGQTRLRDALLAMLEARTLPRERTKGAGTVAYDLRPLLVDLDLAAPGPPPVLRARTVIHPSLGSGRPEEIVAALGDALGVRLEVADIARERLILAA